jgi:hypothetical protein
LGWIGWPLNCEAKQIAVVVPPRKADRLAV